MDFPGHLVHFILRPLSAGISHDLDISAHLQQFTSVTSNSTTQSLQMSNTKITQIYSHMERRQ